MKYLFFWLASLTATFLVPMQTLSAAKTLDYIVAVVNDGVILRSELDRYLQGIVQQLRAKNTPMPPMEALEKQALERLIVRSLQLQRAERTGIQVDDTTLNRSLQEIASKNRMNLEQFRYALESQGRSYEDFREDIRDEIIISRLRQRDVINQITINNREINDYLARNLETGNKNQLLSFSHILISLPGEATTEQVQAAEAKANEVMALIKQGNDFSQTAVAYSDGQKALEGGQYDLRPVSQTPPLFTRVLLKLQPGEISEIFRSPYGFHILRLDRLEGQQQQHIVAQTRLRHILIRTNDLITTAEAKTRLQQIRERLIAGKEDFATLARAHSDDTLSAKEGGNLGWIGPGETVPRFEQAFDALATGEISEPVETRYGWHLIQVLERRQHDDTDKFMRNQAIENIKEQKTSEELQSWLRRLRDEAYVETRLGQHDLQP